MAFHCSCVEKSLFAFNQFMVCCATMLALYFNTFFAGRLVFIGEIREQN